MKKLLREHIYMLLLLMGSHISAQNFDNYQQLKSTGTVPQNFIKSSEQKAEDQIDNEINQGGKHKYKRQKKTFIIESNYTIDELLLSGRVLFNDTVGRYCNKIVDNLLKDDTTLRSQISVYVVKSSVVNAFTTSNGIIFINLGLIAKLNSEAELAFVLCHEIIHYKNKHVLTEFDITQDIKRGKGSFRNASFTDKLLAQSMFSKELETEADIEGLKLFLRSKYSLTAANGVFDVLQYSHIPFSNIPFNKSFLETGTLKLPASYQLKETREVVGEVKDDLLGTHPGIALRRDTIKKSIDSIPNEGRVNFLSDSNSFIFIREISRFEVTEFFLESRQYEAALYSAYSLLDKHKNSIYLQKAVNRALYGLAKYLSVKNRYKEIHRDFMKVQGGQQQIYFLYSRLKSSEACVVSMNYAWSLKRKYPGDDELASIANDILLVAVDNFFPKRDFFSDKPNTLNPKDTSSTIIDFKMVDEAELKSVAKQKRKRRVVEGEKVQQTKTVPSYLSFALGEIVKDKEFAKNYDELTKTRRKRFSEIRERRKDEYKEKAKREYEKQLSKGQPMGIQKIVFVNPFYYKVSIGYNTETFKNVEAEKSQANFNKNMKDVAEAAGIDYVLLDKKNLEETGSDAFNDISTLSSWIEEYYDHGDSMHFSNYKREEIKSLITKYKTKYFCWTGIIATRSPNNNRWKNYGRLTLGVTLPPLLPYLIYKMTQPLFYTFHYTIIINLETGKAEYLQLHEYKSKDRNDVTQASLYDLFLQISAPKNAQ